jgi:hypothetical protein
VVKLLLEKGAELETKDEYSGLDSLASPLAIIMDSLPAMVRF